MPSDPDNVFDLAAARQKRRSAAVGRPLTPSNHSLVHLDPKLASVSVSGSQAHIVFAGMEIECADGVHFFPTTGGRCFCSREVWGTHMRDESKP